MFVGLSATIWFLVNGFEVAREEGFDPLRYEYFARSDLPEYLADSSSYTIVLLLKFIYQHLPFYIGFVAFIGLCVFAVLNGDDRKELRYATLSPLAFFYVAQTGKDGLAILALASIAIIATKRISVWHAALAIVISIAVLVRPALVLFLPLAFVSIRYGLRKATAFAVVVSAVFLATGTGEESLSMLEGIVSDEGSGALAQLGRELTLGYSPIPVAGRSILLLVSPFIQPLGSVVKFLSGADPFVIFEGACQLLFLFALIRHRILTTFIVNSIPFIVVVAAASPFYHFRYMAILYPVIFSISILSRQRTSQLSEYRNLKRAHQANPTAHLRLQGHEY
ncbi:hypothetical protein ASD35_24975 [Pelomonas sp. Root1444]|nr:hypothetical protein ASD35_24975 [Pelomonas sp. Root1444]